MFWMWYQVMVTGARPAGDGVGVAAVVGGRRRRGRRRGRGAAARAGAHDHGRRTQESRAILLVTSPAWSPSTRPRSSRAICLAVDHGAGRPRVRAASSTRRRTRGPTDAGSRRRRRAPPMRKVSKHATDIVSTRTPYEGGGRASRPFDRAAAGHVALGSDSSQRLTLRETCDQATQLSYTAVHGEHARGQPQPTEPGTTIAVIAAAGRRLRPDRLEGHQRPLGRVAARRAVASRPRSSGARLPAGRRGRSRRAPLIEVIFHELESEWALEIVRGVERVAGRHQLAVVLTEMQGRRTPGRGWIEGVLARRPMGVIAVFSDLERGDARAAPRPRHPVRRRRPDRRAAPRHAVDRRDELERRPDGDPPPARPRPPTDRRHRRARRGSCAAAPGWTAFAPPWTRPACRSTASLVSHGAFQVDEGIERGRALLRAAIARRRSSPATTSRRSASTRPRARLRLHIPEDLSVVGFDDLPVARWVEPAADDDPPAARRDGRRGGRARPRPSRAARSRRRRGSSSRRSWSSARARRRRARPDRARVPRGRLGRTPAPDRQRFFAPPVFFAPLPAFAASAWRAASQSFRNWTMPLSVSG